MPSGYELVDPPSYGEGIAGLELDQNPGSLRLRLVSELPLGAEEPGEAIIHWWAELVYPGPELGVDLDRDEILRDLVLAWGIFQVLDFERCRSEGFDPADALGADPELATLAPLLSGSHVGDYVQPDDSRRGLLIVDKVFVPARFEGRHLGSLLVALALRELTQGRLAVCRPGASDLGRPFPEQEQARAKARRTCEELGFGCFAEGLLYLDADPRVLREKVAFFVSRVDEAPPIVLP